MLVLSRKVGEKILIGENITLTIGRIGGNRVAVGVQAPQELRVLRGELELPAVEFQLTTPLADLADMAEPVPNPVAAP